MTTSLRGPENFWFIKESAKIEVTCDHREDLERVPLHPTDAEIRMNTAGYNRVKIKNLDTL